MILYPNAKINIGLNVLEKREDGFHNLETLFYPVGVVENPSDGLVPQQVVDVLEIVEAPQLQMHQYGIEYPGDPMDNLCVKAYKALRKDFDIPPVAIHLYKKIPVGAGLGGGSSDAAFTLRGLNEMFSLGLSDAQLAVYAATLGSDCAFFIYNRPMIGEGRGEVLSEYPVSGLDYGQNPADEVFECAKGESAQENMAAAYEITVLTPEGIAVSTADAYRGIKPQLPEIPLKEALAKPVEEWKDCLFNDFETTVFDKHPELAAIKRSLYDSGAVYASMSGSGSALFAIYRK